MSKIHDFEGPKFATFCPPNLPLFCPQMCHFGAFFQDFSSNKLFKRCNRRVHVALIVGSQAVKGSYQWQYHNYRFTTITHMFSFVNKWHENICVSLATTLPYGTEHRPFARLSRGPPLREIFSSPPKLTYKPLFQLPLNQPVIRRYDIVSSATKIRKGRVPSIFW